MSGPRQQSSGENTENEILHPTQTSTTFNSKKTYNRLTSDMDEITLKVNGDLDTMTQDWSLEELYDSRRIVVFRKPLLIEPSLEINFDAAVLNAELTTNFCISCLKKDDIPGYYFTQDDIIRLIEWLLTGYPPYRSFSAEQKSQVLHSLDNFCPLTVSKVKAETEDLFKLIMGLSNPQPSNFEVEIEVHRWETLLPALEAAVGNYNTILKTYAQSGQPTNFEYARGDYLRFRSKPPGIITDKSGGSNSPGLDLDKRHIYISGLANSFVSIVKGLHPDEDALNRISDILPTLLEAFALRICYKPPTLRHRNIGKFVFENRQ